VEESEEDAAAPFRALSASAAAAASASASASPGGGRLSSTTSSIDGDESTELVSHDLGDEAEGAQQRSDGTTGGSGDGGSGSKPPVAGLIVLDPAPPAEGEMRVTLMRLGGSGHGNIELNVLCDARVSQLLSRVFERELAERQRVRVFFRGRVLREDEALEDAGVTDGCVLHTHFLPPLAGDAPPGDAEAPRGEVLMDSSSGFSDSDGNAFPALAGYSPAQIEQLRQAQAQMDLELQMAAAHGGPYAVREGSTGELILGFFIGFILGWLSILWLYSPSLSRKQRLGILLGLTLNLIMLIANWLDPPQQQGTGGSADQVPSPVVDPKDGAEGVIDS